MYVGLRKKLRKFTLYVNSSFMLDKRNFYINGKWVKPTNPNDLEVINPSTEEACAVISLGSKGLKVRLKKV